MAEAATLDPAQLALERALIDSHGGVAAQPPLAPPDHVPVGVPHTAYEEVPAETFLGPAGAEQWLVNKQGLRLKSYFWPASQPRAVVLFVHGHGAHLQFEILAQTELGQPMQYKGSWVERWNAAGLSVCGIDMQGCGRSEGLHGLRWYVERFDDYVDDVVQLARMVDAQEVSVPGFGGLPHFISGISLGGCIAFNAVLQEKQLFRGAALMAPMLSLERVSRQGLNPYLRPVANLLSRLAPTAAIVATDKNVLFPAIQQIWDKDPLTCRNKTRVRNASEYLRATEQTMARLEEADFPFLLFHSENDTMTDADGSKQLYQRARSGDKQLRLVNDNWHVLVREKGNERICSEIAEWVLQRA